jgi:DMSO/TMAO reductase YedYZ molybdopterin-dependent catalytic subunit
MKLSRRSLLKASLLAGSAKILLLDKIAWPESSTATNVPLSNSKQLGVVDFKTEAWTPMDTAVGTELDGRLYTDLSGVSPQNPTIPTERFFVRTRASAFLDDQKPWRVNIAGLVTQPVSLTIDDLSAMAKPMGLHLMECAGNPSSARFGMMGVAGWNGILLSDLLGQIKMQPQASRVMISGFDRYLSRSRTSIPGASWVFAPEQLNQGKAFLATAMNGQPLTKDHGAPVRLMVPGWYGCTCIKWVNEITLVADEIEATSQMQEYAGRTLQEGAPKLARDYRAALIEQAAMPIRIEKWVEGGKINYRVAGILWGGSRRINTLEVQFNPAEPFVAVDNFQHPANDPWGFWTHVWSPARTGTYRIQLRVKDPAVPARKMDAGYYARSVEITEI